MLISILGSLGLCAGIWCLVTALLRAMAGMTKVLAPSSPILIFGHELRMYPQELMPFVAHPLKATESDVFLA